MANAMYAKGRNAFLLGDIDWVADSVSGVLVDAADYTINLATHEFLSDIPVGARVSTSALAGKTAVDGVADANDLVFTGVTGDPCELLILYKNTGNAATSNLIAAIDTATGLPVTPNSGDITVQWDNGANKIFKL